MTILLLLVGLGHMLIGVGVNGLSRVEGAILLAFGAYYFFLFKQL